MKVISSNDFYHIRSRQNEGILKAAQALLAAP